MAAKIKVIQLKGERDCNIAQWCIMVKEQWNGGINYLVKKAIRSYIKDGTFICIGKIHACKDSKKVLSQQTCISLWLADSPDIMQWISCLEKSVLRPATLIREIVRKSIEIIPDGEEEWIPSVLDFETDVLEIAARMSGFSHISSSSELKEVSMPTPPPSSVDTQGNENQTHNESVQTVPHVIARPEGVSSEGTRSEGHKKKPRAAALTGRRFVQY